jgi:hypothetical protein
VSWTARQRAQTPEATTAWAMDVFDTAGVPRQCFCHAMANPGRNPLARRCGSVPGPYRHEPNSGRFPRWSASGRRGRFVREVGSRALWSDGAVLKSRWDVVNCRCREVDRAAGVRRPVEGARAAGVRRPVEGARAAGVRRPFENATLPVAIAHGKHVRRQTAREHFLYVFKAGLTVRTALPVYGLPAYDRGTSCGEAGTRKSAGRNTDWP